MIVYVVPACGGNRSRNTYAPLALVCTVTLTALPSRSVPVSVSVTLAIGFSPPSKLPLLLLAGVVEKSSNTAPASEPRVSPKSRPVTPADGNAVTSKTLAVFSVPLPYPSGWVSVTR